MNACVISYMRQLKYNAQCDYVYYVYMLCMSVSVYAFHHTCHNSSNEIIN